MFFVVLVPVYMQEETEGKEPHVGGGGEVGEVASQFEPLQLDLPKAWKQCGGESGAWWVASLCEPVSLQRGRLIRQELEVEQMKQRKSGWEKGCLYVYLELFQGIELGQIQGNRCSLLEFGWQR